MTALAQAAELFPALFGVEANIVKQEDLSVRNTFIHVPADWFTSDSRRVQSTPPNSRGSEEEPCDDISPGTPRLRADPDAGNGRLSPNRMAVPSSLGKNQCCQVDPYFPDVDLFGALTDARRAAALTWLDERSLQQCDAQAAHLATLVPQECGFLRLNGHTVHFHTKAHSLGYGLTIRFYVVGLPWAKRSKWQQPLFWTVARVLQRAGCDARVRSGQLLVPVTVDVSVRVDFVAGRHV